MAKISEYMIGKDGKQSTSRLCMVWGLIITGICVFAQIIASIWIGYQPNVWTCVLNATPGVIGLLPYTIIQVKQIVLQNPEIIDKLKGGEWKSNS